MRIEELKKFYDRSKNKLKNLNRFYDKKIKELNKLNQDIFFTDLVLLTAYSDSFGESNRKESAHDIDEFTRLTDHLASIFYLTREDHRANYCERGPDDKYQLLKCKENHITRLSTCEFAFYTQQPLSTETFSELCELFKTL